MGILLGERKRPVSNKAAIQGREKAVSPEREKCVRSIKSCTTMQRLRQKEETCSYINA
jgi:hypothetical protein